MKIRAPAMRSAIGAPDSERLEGGQVAAGRIRKRLWIDRASFASARPAWPSSRSGLPAGRLVLNSPACHVAFTRSRQKVLETPEQFMDLNYLFHRQQVERSLSDSAASDAARQIHSELAREYERQIEQLSCGPLSFLPTELRAD
ncbi:MAG: hypothetical protein ABIO80_04570 [Sphingomicrobium sp.]